MTGELYQVLDVVKDRSNSRDESKLSNINFDEDEEDSG